MFAPHLQDELATVEVGHHEICDDKVDGATLVENSQRLAPVARCADEVAESCEESVQGKSDAAFVVDDKHMRDGIVGALRASRA